MASDSTRLSPRAHFVVKIRETRQCRASGPVWSFALQLSTTCTSPAEKNLVYCSPRRSAGRLEICLFTCKLIREHVVHKSAKRQHTLRTKRVLPEGTLFDEKICQRFFVRLRVPLRTIFIQRTFFLEQSSSRTVEIHEEHFKGSLSHNMKQFFVEVLGELFCQGFLFFCTTI